MTIGEILRKAREEKGVSLAEVENETKIRRKYIAALESNDFDVLPGKIYVKGFLRNYARYLGLEGEALVKEFEDMFPQQEDPGLVVDSRTTTEFAKPARSRRGLVAVAAVLLVGALFYWWGAAGTVPGDDISGGGREQNMPAGEDRDAGDGSPGRNGAAPGDPNRDNGVGPGPVQRGINVVLEVTDKDCWMHVVVDNQNEFQGLVSPGNTKEFKGEDRVWLKLGDAGAVRVLVNGNDYGFLGERGRVVTRTFEAGENGGDTVGG